MQWLLLAMVSFSASLSQAEVLAKVGSKEITTKEFDEKYEQIKKQVVDAPDKKDFLEDLINFEVGIQEAQKRNLDQDPIIKERLEQELFKGFVEKEANR